MDAEQERIKKNLFNKIMASLNRLEAKRLINEDVTILDIFINLPITPHYTTEFFLGGMGFPLIALLGKSGRVYFFALRHLLSEREIEDATKK